MGHHDAILILIAGVLLAAGIAGALLADRVRVPALLLFLGLGMLAGSEGIGDIHFSNYEPGADAGDDRAGPDPLRGRAHLGLVGDPPGARHGGLAGHPGDAGDGAPGRGRVEMDLRPQLAGRDDRRLRDRRHRLGRDLRRAAQLDPGEAPGALARGRVGDERPGRPAAGDRLHRMDPAAELRRRRHDRADRAEDRGRDRRRAGPGTARGLGARTGSSCPPTGSTRWRRSPSRRSPTAISEVAQGSGPARRLPDRAGARLGADPGQAQRRLLPRGARLGVPDRPLHPARAARLPRRPGRASRPRAWRSRRC